MKKIILKKNKGGGVSEWMGGCGSLSAVLSEGL